jgi:hypothetical protein
MTDIVDMKERKDQAIQLAWDNFVEKHREELERGGIEAHHVFQAGWSSARLFDHEIDLAMGDLMMENANLKKQIKEMSH